MKRLWLVPMFACRAKSGSRHRRSSGLSGRATRLHRVGRGFNPLSAHHIHDTCMRILVGILIAAFGALMTIKAEGFYRTIGPVAWAERHLGVEGGSRLWYKLLGILITLIGLFMATGLLEGVLTGIFGTLFSGLRR